MHSNIFTLLVFKENVQIQGEGTLKYKYPQKVQF